MKRFVLTAALLVATISFAADVKAESWIFRRSYYTHQDGTPVRIGPRASRGPFYEQPVGEYVRAGYQHIRSFITVDGISYGHVNHWESWIQTGSQN